MLRRFRRIIKSASILGLMLLASWFYPCWFSGVACGIWLTNVIIDVIDCLDL